MRIRSLSVEGFRGFHEHREIRFDDKLTVFYAPNSYGKTSITEALEWLLYGYTSKVKGGDYSKEEYKDSYRNVHCSDGTVPYVAASFAGKDEETTLRAELPSDGECVRYVNGARVAEWPFIDDSSTARPFILQHALKNLLLAKPTERYQAFALLLGLDDLEKLQQDFVSLATRYRPPAEVERLVAEVDGLFATAGGRPALAGIFKLYKSGKSADDIYAAVLAASRTHVGAAAEQGRALPELISLREKKAGGVFPMHIRLGLFTEQQATQHREDSAHFAGFVTEGLLEQYLALTALATVSHIHDRARFFDLGIRLLEESPENCPLCGRVVDSALVEHIDTCHKVASGARQNSARLEQQRTEVLRLLTGLERRLEANYALHANLVKDFVTLKPLLGQLSGILAAAHEEEFLSVEEAVNRVDTAKQHLGTAYQVATDAIKSVSVSVEQSSEDVSLLKRLGEALLVFVDQARGFGLLVMDSAPAAAKAADVLTQELDARAGTEDIAVLIELLQNHKKVDKKRKVDGILAGLKGLRHTVDQMVSARILQVIAGDLTAGVLGWYDQIKTTCDPEVHFCGFDVPRTKTGDLKARCISINAESYGKNLPSAVSSLSESKLNALGLCLCIGSNMSSACPFDFLIIDDPIQSLDSAHEAQFVEILRELVERGKQVIVLSHNKQWVDQLVANCRSLNGTYYEITGYDKSGPYIKWQPWERIQARLDTIMSTAKDNAADSAQLGQAEAGLRHVVCQITSDLFHREKGDRRLPDNLGWKEVNKMLTECGVGTRVIDQVKHIFTKADDAHHPGDYAAQRERIVHLHSYACELHNLLKAKAK